ncbi:hypothetical protein [Marinobacterium sp. MBR-109]|jgi:hypothetical protein|uniref:hypothetical protein n=1 Tax=Marinobacterium sp. MBR-109 TaxID=3156462 RepID=UPI00339962BA
MNELYIVNSENDEVIAFAEVSDDDINDLNLIATCSLSVFQNSELIELMGTYYAYTKDQILELGWDTETSIYSAELKTASKNSFMLKLII